MDLPPSEEVVREALHLSDENAFVCFLQDLREIRRINRLAPEKAKKARAAKVEEMIGELKVVRRLLDRAILMNLHENDPFGTRHLREAPIESPSRRELRRSYIEELEREPSGEEREILNLMVSTHKVARTLLELYRVAREA